MGGGENLGIVIAAHTVTHSLYPHGWGRKPMSRARLPSRGRRGRTVTPRRPSVSDAPSTHTAKTKTIPSEATWMPQDEHSNLDFGGVRRVPALERTSRTRELKTET